MIRDIRVERECDNCKSMAITDGGLPEGWSGELPDVLPEDRASFIGNTTSGPTIALPRRQHYCEECIAAVAKARDAALAARQP